MGGAGACDRCEGRRARKVVGVDSWPWRAVPRRLDELGVPIEDVERVASELSRSKLGWHRSSKRLNGLEGRRGVGFGRAMFLHSVLEPLDTAGGGSGGGTGDASEENAYLSRGSTDGTVFAEERPVHIAVYAGLEGKRDAPKVWDSPMLRAGTVAAAEDNRAEELPRTSVRYDFDLARGLAMESDDLPHHPELLFAPSDDPAGGAATRRRAGARRQPKGVVTTTTATTSGRESFSKHQPVPTHHRRSSSVISVGSQHGPAINGVGFGA